MLFSSAWKRLFFNPITLLVAVLAVEAGIWVLGGRFVIAQSAPVDPAADDASKMFLEGRQIFRFDTFGDEAFWGDTLKLHQAIQGSALGGVGSGLSPKAALGLGVKVVGTARIDRRERRQLCTRRTIQLRQSSLSCSGRHGLIRF